MKENNKNKVLKSARIEKEMSDKIDEILYGKKYTFTDVINAALFNFFENKFDEKVMFNKVKKNADINRNLRIRILDKEYEFLQQRAKYHGFNSVAKEIKFQILNTIYDQDKNFNNIEMGELRNAINDLNKLGRNLREILTRLQQNNSYNFTVNYEKFRAFTQSIDNQVGLVTKLINRYISELKLKVR